jgi:hypothetical protein
MALFTAAPPVAVIVPPANATLNYCRLHLLTLYQFRRHLREYAQSHTSPQQVLSKYR